jgi:hypothetical protein
MTEAEWLACADPLQMLRFVSPQASERKLRLFALAAARDLLEFNRWGTPDPYELKAFEAATLRAEVHADGHGPPLPEWYLSTFSLVEHPRATQAAYTVLGAELGLSLFHSDPAEIAPRAVKHFLVNPAHWLRDLFGPLPFRPMLPRPEVIAPLAEEIYADHWELRLLLGEWLQEHGFWQEGEHCLDPSILHVKGCWVVDWVTGRE